MLPRFVSSLATGAAGPTFDLPVWSVIPFALLLLAVALLPLAAEHWWHRNRNKALVAALLAVPVAICLFLADAPGRPTRSALGEEMVKYVSFILLLGSLYIVSGGIVLAGDMQGTPLTNTAFLGCGCVLANVIGTTGASVLLIRPLLRINQAREHTWRLPVFFILTVSNLGGLLTPLGDPPLFLGFLSEVPFFWTFTLWRQWLLVNAVVLMVFFVWDMLAFRRESRASPPPRGDGDGSKAPVHSPLRLRGSINLVFLGGIIAGVLLQRLLRPWGEIVSGVSWADALGGLAMAAMAGFSLLMTPRPLRHANGFTWGPILEVAILFAGIFVTMVPALAILAANREAFGVTEAWQYFWLTGGLSALLDNAPTYLTFATMAAGSTDFKVLVDNQVPGINGPLVLQAISCGAVFMGALTYIGNGPNFMVKAIAEQAGYKAPSFFGYAGWACVILLPLFALVTIVFFGP